MVVVQTGLIYLNLSIGSGDSLTYSPSQTTDICAILNCNGSTYSDTMTINVLDRDISRYKDYYQNVIIYD